jgi:uncharacterized protein (TIGR01732 family)
MSHAVLYVTSSSSESLVADTPRLLLIEGGINMFGTGYDYGAFGGCGYTAPVTGPAYGGGSSFTLIVVLFILLIIVGSAWC